MTLLVRRLTLMLLLTAGLSAVGIAAAAVSPPGSGLATAAYANDDDDEGDDEGDDGVPAGGVETGVGGVLRDEDDDDGVPAGGVETGLGGTASDDGDPLVPLALAGGGVLTAGGGLLLWRRRVMGH